LQLEKYKVNRDNLVNVLLKGYLPFPESVIPPKRERPLWDTLPEPLVDDKGLPLKFHIRQAIHDSIDKIFSNGQIGVLTSGGIDSTVLFMYLCDIFGKRNVRGYFIDFGVYDQTDWLNVANLKMDYDIKVVPMLLSDHLALLRETVHALRSPVGFSTQITHIFKAIKEDKRNVVFSALGLDECMGGYREHCYATDEGFSRVEESLFEVCHANWVWDTLRIGEMCGLEVMFPFLNDDFISYSRGLDRYLKCDRIRTKILLRKEMKGYLPDDIVNAGVIVGTKGGFVPPVNDWWSGGLGEWADSQVSEIPLEFKLRVLGLKETLKWRFYMGKLNRWRVLRLASVPTFLDLLEKGEFD
jgi:hypothetical protein